jgi:hypothetical protein
VDTLIVPIRSEGSGQNLEKEIAFEFSGKKQIEIIGRPKPKNFSIELWLVEKRIEERSIPN